jgi:hypothetical protein
MMARSRACWSSRLTSWRLGAAMPARLPWARSFSLDMNHELALRPKLSHLVL